VASQARYVLPFRLKTRTPFNPISGIKILPPTKLRLLYNGSDRFIPL
jgi:hypothetical protein